MNKTAAQESLDLAGLIGSRLAGFALPRPFYTDPQMFAVDVERVFHRVWLFAGHVSRIPAAGNWFLFTLSADSAIVMRQDDGTVRAMHNVCRHRGSAICTTGTGHAKKLVCPYHQWVYDTDGRLLAARAMPEDFDRSAWGLKPVAVRVVEGFIFVSFADEPEDFDAIRRNVLPFFRPHRFERAKICHTAEYDVKANWKLIIENSRECDHCPVGHPEYTKLMLREGGTETAAELQRHHDERVGHYQNCGLATRHVGDAGHFASRYPFARRGAVSESLDGKPVAPLMGVVRGPRRGGDGGDHPAELHVRSQHGPRGVDAVRAGGCDADTGAHGLVRARRRRRGARLRGGAPDRILEGDGASKTGSCARTTRQG